jgi:hypothetical protein
MVVLLVEVGMAPAKRALEYDARIPRSYLEIVFAHAIHSDALLIK